jgi:hypothetical protein
MMESIDRGVLDTPLEPVIGLAGGETRWRSMTVFVKRRRSLALSNSNSDTSAGVRAGQRGSFATHHGSCEFGFCRKGFAPGAEIQLAVRRQPVYNPALRCFR